MKILLLPILFLVLLTGCSQKKYELFKTDRNVTTRHAKKSISLEYYILPQDRLKISIYKNPEETDLLDSYANLSTQMGGSGGILVNSRGYIRLPLIGQIKVSGLTQYAAANKIARKYSGRLRHPSVYLEVLNKRAYILGEVRKPGVLKLINEKMTLLEALAYGGGMTDSAIRDSIIIISKNRYGKLSMRKVDLTNFESLNQTDMIIRPNDVVYVKPDGWKHFKVTSSDIAPIFSIVSTVAQPFMTLKYLSN